jgi:DNA-directed RNA polymerase subunit RPC12/RpoP
VKAVFNALDMTSATVMMRCAKCGQGFRILAAAGTVHVTCPKCSAQWDWPEAGVSGATPEEASNAQANEFWREMVLQPRLSYAASTVVLLAGLGLGIFCERFQQRRGAEEEADSFELTNAPPLVQPQAKTAGAPGAHPTNLVPSVEGLLPSNGVDFNPTNPVGTKL